MYLSTYLFYLLSIANFGFPSKVFRNILYVHLIIRVMKFANTFGSCLNIFYISKIALVLSNICLKFFSYLYKFKGIKN